MTRVVQALIITVAALIMQSAVASDVDEITALLQDFLANSHKEAAHERFWAEDLVYSSSAGPRFGKAEIMEGFESNADEIEGANDEPEVTYA
jgi:ketosteroid isomerase-like protein